MNIDGIDTGTNLTSSGKIATECLRGSGSSTSSQNRPRESSVYRTASLILLSDDLTAAIFVQITPPGMSEVVGPVGLEPTSYGSPPQCSTNWSPPPYLSRAYPQSLGESQAGPRPPDTLLPFIAVAYINSLSGEANEMSLLSWRRYNIC